MSSVRCASWVALPLTEWASRPRRVPPRPVRFRVDPLDRRLVYRRGDCMNGAVRADRRKAWEAAQPSFGVEPKPLGPTPWEVDRRKRGMELEPLEFLSPREDEVLALIAKGLDNAAIAQDLVIEMKTIDRHINNIYAKLFDGEQRCWNRRVRAALLYREKAELA